MELSDDVPGIHCRHRSIASLAPDVEITMFPWKEPEELKRRTIDRVHRYSRCTSRCVLPHNEPSKAP
jgi:hypothetical protein